MCRQLEHVEPFTRKIHESELWLYKNPRVESYVSATVLWVSSMFNLINLTHVHSCVYIHELQSNEIIAIICFMFHTGSDNYCSISSNYFDFNVPKRKG